MPDALEVGPASARTRPNGDAAPTDIAHALAAIGAAVQVLERAAPVALQIDVQELAKRLHWLTLGLTPDRTCTACGHPFTFDAVLCAVKRHRPPTTCRHCRA